MNVQSVRVRFESKIPGAVQYSSLTFEGEMTATLDEGESPTAAIDHCMVMLKDAAKAHLVQSRKDQRAQTGGYDG